MKTMSRRSLFTGGALLGAALVSGCVTSKVGHVTTVTLSVAKIRNYAQAGIDAATTVNRIASAFPALSSFTIPIGVALTALDKAVTTFNGVVGDKITVVYNSTDVRSAVDSILDIIQQILDIVGSVALSAIGIGLPVSSDTVNKVEITRDLLSTIVSVFKALLSSTFAYNDAKTENKALIGLHYLSANTLSNGRGNVASMIHIDEFPFQKV